MRSSDLWIIWLVLALGVRIATAGEPVDSLKVSDVHRTVPEDHTLSTVSVRVGKRHGSGFFLSFGDDFYFVTAKHVVYDPRGRPWGRRIELQYWSHPSKGPKREAMVIDLVAAAKTDSLLSSYNADVFTVRIGDGAIGERIRRAPYVTGRGSLIHTPRDSLLPFTDVKIGNDVYLYGYPTAIGIRKSPQVDFSRPLLRKGAIAGINSSLRTIILDVAVHGGNSGGPVWHVERRGHETRYRIAGVVTQFVPLVDDPTHIDANTDQDNSGYAVAVPIDVVIALVESGRQSTIESAPD